MCLLVVLHQVVPGWPLVVAANRDERLDRPATAATILQAGDPRIVGGRDELAGGTWLAVNEHGVVAGLTNRPVEGGRDLTKRSRGELPLALAGHPDAAEAAGQLARTVPGEAYNPCWMLVGDRRSLWAVAVDRPGPPAVRRLGPGVHVLENRALDEPSPKVDRVRALLDAVRLAGSAGPAAAGSGGSVASVAPAALVADLGAVLADHQVPGGDPEGPVPGDWRPAVVSACCVHTPEYGTRSSTVVLVPEGDGVPSVHVADGPPCTAPFLEVTSLWDAPLPGAAARRRTGKRPG